MIVVGAIKIGKTSVMEYFFDIYYCNHSTETSWSCVVTSLC